MQHKQLISSALATALALGLVGQAQAAEKAPHEKCFGIAKAGQNDCANLSGSHACAGQTAATGAPDDWKYVPKGECKNLKGLTEEEAKAKLKK